MAAHVGERVIAPFYTGVEAMAIQGDDILIIYSGVEKGRPSHPVIEYQPMDTKYEWYLGLAFSYPDRYGKVIHDRDHPRIFGFKGTIDRADRALGGSFEYDGSATITVAGSNKPLDRQLWLEMTQGNIGGKSILDRLRTWPPGSFRNWGELVHAMIAEVKEEGYSLLTEV